jgi:dTDP-4-dehydrorhamnose reductase
MISYLDVIQPKLIYLSNCYVFDGFRGNYKENDTLLPGSALGRIKASAESSIRNRCLNYVIVRSPPLLGRGLIFHTSLFDQWRDRLSREVTVDASVQEIHSFSLVDAFCDFMQTLINANVKNRVLHFSGHTKLSTFDLAVRFARTFNLPETLIIPKKLSLSQANSSSSTKSEITFTFDFSLNCSQSIELLNLKPLLIEEALKQLKEKLA